MLKDLATLQDRLESGALPNASRDMYNLTALHYASHHCCNEMVRALLNCGADPLAMDEQKRLPIYRAVLRCDEKVVELLLGSMEQCTTLPLDAGMLANLTAAALETLPDTPSLPEGLVRRLVIWASKHITEGSGSLWVHWAKAGCAAAFERALCMCLDHCLGCIDDQAMLLATAM